MKRRDLEKKLQKLGVVIGAPRKQARRMDGRRKELAVPLHNEINELLARKILGKARKR